MIKGVNKIPKGYEGRIKTSDLPCIVCGERETWRVPRGIPWFARVAAEELADRFYLDVHVFDHRAKLRGIVKSYSKG